MWGSETLTASDLNSEFNNVLNSALSLISPLTGSLDFDGFALTLDAAAATTVQSTAALAWTFTPGAKTGTPGTTGAVSNWAANTYTDNNTAGSGTATAFVAHAFQRPTLVATNATVTTTDAATVYIANSPADGTNNTIANAWALWVDAGNVRLDGATSSRTNTVTTPLTIQSVTSGTPAAGIGTGILIQAESADENPSNFGQIEFAATDIDAGTEDTYFQILLRVAGAALTSCYRFAATGAFNAIFTHANTAARTYTLPNRSETICLVTLAAEQAATAGTSIDFTGIPAGTKRITIHFVGVSQTGTDDLLIQIGDAGGIEATGYLGAGGIVREAGATNILNFTSGWGIETDATAAAVLHGQIVLMLEDASDFTWTCSAVIGFSNGAGLDLTAGSKSLSAELDRVRITTVGGANTFDAGAINITYES